MPHANAVRRNAETDLYVLLEPRMLFSGGWLAHPIAPGEANQVATADFDGDGDADVAAVFEDDSQLGLNILTNDGSGVLSLAQEFSTPILSGTPLNVAAVDFDNDGDVDVIALGLRLFRNNGSGVFSDAELLSNGSAGSTVRIADANGDDLPDVFTHDSFNQVIRLHRNLAGASLDTAEALLTAAPQAAFIGAADMDGDGDIDLVTSTENHVRVHRSTNGIYNTTLVTSAPTSFLDRRVLQDINSDGLPDVVWAGGRLFSMMNEGDGTFAPIVESGSSAWYSLHAMADFNADGEQDVLGLAASLVCISFATTPGVFSDHLQQVSETFVSFPYLFAAEMDGDGSADVLMVRPNVRSGTLAVYYSVPGPTITEFTAPAEPFVPGRELALDLRIERGEDVPVTAVEVYFDINEDGLYTDGVDTFFASGVQVSPGSEFWTATALIGDGYEAGGRQFVAIAHDESRATSDPATLTVVFWTRVFYPEGWRNDTTINEYVPMVNPNPFPVDYRLVAHYETGERDVVIAEGTIAASTRGGATISEHANPAGALVRLNEGYSLELQSTAFLGAMLSHYDSFTGAAGVSAATGEAFTGSSSSVWYFADASTEDASFIVIFNPSDIDVEVTFTFYDDDNSFVMVNRTIGALRRGGIALRDPALGLAADTNHAVVITSGSRIVAAQSSYSLTDGTGYTSLGASPANDSTDYQIEFRDGLTNRLTLFNTNTGFSQTVAVFISYPGIESPVERFYVLQALERRVVDLDALAPDGATHAAVRVSPFTLSFVESVDLTRGDSTAATPAGQSATTWAFADGFLDRETAGMVGFESLSIFNRGTAATNVTIRFLYADASAFDMNISIDAMQSTRLNLDELSDVYGRFPLNFFSIMVYADEPVVANMTHWDLFQGGGWSTLGTPGGSIGPV